MTKKRNHTSFEPHAISLSASHQASVPSRREILAAGFLGIAALGLLGPQARAFAAKASDATLSALSGAQAEYEAAMAELASIGAQLEESQFLLSECQANLDATNQQIDDLVASIRQNQDELASAQDVLAARINASYRAGNADLLAILLDAASFDDLVSRLYYAGKVSDSDTEAIQRVKDIKAELEAQEQSLLEQQAAQEQLLADQQAYTDSLASTVAYYESYTANLSSEVTALMNQAQQELLAAQQAEYEAYLAQQQAAQAPGSNQGSTTGSSGSTTPAPQPDPIPSDPVSPDPAPDPAPQPEPDPDPGYQEPEDPWGGWEPEPEPEPDPAPSYGGGNHVYAVADIAWNYIGVPYVWGGTSPSGFDCSGLAQYCYAQAGYYIGRTTYDQAANISARGQMTYSMSDLEPGDLLFPHSDHVGIYEGGGMMIHAPYPGEYVKYVSVYGFSFGGCPV